MSSPDPRPLVVKTPLVEQQKELLAQREREHRALVKKIRRENKSK